MPETQPQKKITQEAVQELLNGLSEEVQKNLILQIVNYSNNVIGSDRKVVATSIAITAYALKQHLNEGDKLEESLYNTVECARTGNKEQIKECLMELENDNKKSCLILPLTTQGHLFDLVIHKENNEYKCMAVNKGGRENERGSMHHSFERYTLSEDKIEQLVANVDIHETTKEMKTSAFYELLNQLSGAEKNPERMEKIEQIIARDQTVGNCFIKENLEAIKTEYALSHDNFEEVSFWHNDKAVNLSVPKWPVDTKDMYNEILKIIRDNTKYPEVKEFADKEIDTYNKDKDFRAEIKKNIAMTFEQKKELLIRTFNSQEIVDINKLKDKSFLKECLKGVDSETLKNNFDFFMDVLIEANVEIPVDLKRNIQYFGLRENLADTMLQNEEPTKTFLNDYFPDVLDDVKKIVAIEYNKKASKEIALGNLKEADELLNKSLQNYDGYYKVYLDKAQINFKLQKFEEAKQYYKRAYDIGAGQNDKKIVDLINAIDTLQAAIVEEKELEKKYSPNLPIDDVIKYMEKKNAINLVFYQLGETEQCERKTTEIIEVVDKVLDNLNLQDGNNIEKYFQINMIKLSALSIAQKPQQVIELCQRMEQLGKKYGHDVNNFSNIKISFMINNPGVATLKQLENAAMYVQNFDVNGLSKEYMLIRQQMGETLERNGEYNLAKNEYNYVKSVAMLYNNSATIQQMDLNLQRCEVMMPQALNNDQINLQQIPVENSLKQEGYETSTINTTIKTPDENQEKYPQISSEIEGSVLKNEANDYEEAKILEIQRLESDDERFNKVINLVGELDDEAKIFSLGNKLIERLENDDLKVRVTGIIMSNLEDEKNKYDIAVKAIENLESGNKVRVVLRSAMINLKDDNRRCDLFEQGIIGINDPDDKISLFTTLMSGTSGAKEGIYNIGMRLVNSLNKKDDKIELLNEMLKESFSGDKRIEICKEKMTYLDKSEDKLMAFSQTINSLESDTEKGNLTVSALSILNKDEYKLELFKRAMPTLTNLQEKHMLTTNVLNSLKDKEKQLEVVENMLQEYEKVGTMDYGLINQKVSILSQINKEEALKVIDDLEGKGLSLPLDLSYRRINILSELGRKNEAVSEIKYVQESLQKMNIEDKGLHNLEVNILFDIKGRENEALNLMLYAESVGTKFDWSTLNKKANVLLQAGNKNEALKVYEQMLDLAPTNRKIINIVKQLSDEKILTQALASKIYSLTLEKLDTVNFNRAKNEDLTKLLTKIGDIDISLATGTQKIKVFFKTLFKNKDRSLVNEAQKIKDKIQCALLKREADYLLKDGKNKEALKKYEQILNIMPHDKKVINIVKQLSNEQSKNVPDKSRRNKELLQKGLSYKKEKDLDNNLSKVGHIQLKTHDEILFKFDGNRRKSSVQKGLEIPKNMSFEKKHDGMDKSKM